MGTISLDHLACIGYRPANIPERELCIDNLLVRIHFIIEMICWTGLAPWEIGFPYPGSLISTFLANILPLSLPWPEFSAERPCVKEPYWWRSLAVQGYLAHKKTPTPPGPPYDPRHRPTVGSWGIAFFKVRYPCRGGVLADANGWRTTLGPWA